MFRDLQIKIATSQRFLEGILGNSIEKWQLVIEKVDTWIYYVQKIGQAAQKSLQAAFTTFTKSLQSEWRLFQRITEGFNEEYENLKTAIHQNFTPNIFAQDISDIQHELFTLPTRYGGLNIQNPIKSSEN